MIKYRLSIILSLLFIILFSVSVYSAEEAVYVTGEVTKYTDGESITLKDAGGKEISFKINKNTHTTGKIDKGVMVEVEATGSKATYIGVATVGSDEEEEAVPGNVTE